MIPRFKCLVVDPPWSYGDEGRITKSTASGKESRDILDGSITRDYDGTMSIPQIKQFPINDLADPDNALIFLWTTNRHLQWSFDILRWWRFKYSFVMVWVKPGGAKADNCAIMNNEFVVCGYRGKYTLNNRWTTKQCFKTAFNAPREGHSVKPAYFYRLLRRVTRPPRIDIFARRRHEGFSAFGNQVERHADDLLSHSNPQTTIIPFLSGEIHIDETEDISPSQPSLLNEE